MNLSLRRLAGIFLILALASLAAVPASAGHGDAHATIKYWNTGALSWWDPHETTEDIDGVTGHVATPSAKLTLATSMENTGGGYCGPLYWNPATNVFKTYQVTGGFQAAIDVNREAPVLTGGGATFQPGDVWMTVQGSYSHSMYVQFKNSDNFRRYGFPSSTVGIRVNQDTGKVYAADFYTGAIHELDPATNALRSWAVGNRPYWVDIDSAGRVYTAAAAAGGFGDQIVRLDPATGAVRRWDLPGGGLQTFTSFGMPNSVRVDPEGNLWFSQTTINTVGRLRVASNDIDQYSKPGMTDPNGIAASGSGATLQAFFTERNVDHISLVTAAAATPTVTNVAPADSTVTPTTPVPFVEDFTIAPLEATIEPLVFDSPGVDPSGILRFPAPAAVSGPAGMSRVAEPRTIYGSFEGSDHVFRLESDAIVAPPAGHATAEGYAARARVEALPLDTAKIARAFVADVDLSDDEVILSESVPSVLDVSVAHATASTAKTSDTISEADGTETITHVDILGGTVTADLVRAVAHAEYDSATGSGSVSAAGSGFVNVTVASNNITDPIAPNTSITVPGVATVVLNEQIPVVDGNGAAIRVNMIHVTVPDDSIEVIVSSAFAGAGSTEVPDEPPVRLPPLPEPPSGPPSGLPPVECLTGDPLLTEGFEDGLGSFSTDNANVWDAGAPTWPTGPGVAAEGASVAGTQVANSYPVYESGSLISPAIDLTGFDPAGPGICEGLQATLHFQGWYQSYYYDCGYIEVSTDGGTTWTQVEPVPGYNFAYTYYCGPIYPPTGRSFSAYGIGAWTAYDVDLNPYAGMTVQVRFQFGGYYPYNSDDGWSVDAVSVTLS